MKAMIVVFAAAALAAGCGQPPAIQATAEDLDDANMLTLYEFPQAFESGQWPVINDTVMGGVSQSAIARTADGRAAFTGSVSLDNFGGFASVRSPHTERDLGGYTGLAVRVRGDGKRYKLFLKHDLPDDGTMYWADIKPPAGEWATLLVPFERFRPHWRGMPLLFQPPAGARTVRAVGFLIADKQEGPFRLEVAWIKAYRQEWPSAAWTAERRRPDALAAKTCEGYHEPLPPRFMRCSTHNVCAQRPPCCPQRTRPRMYSPLAPSATRPGPSHT